MRRPIARAHPRHDARRTRSVQCGEWPYAGVSPAGGIGPRRTVCEEQFDKPVATGNLYGKRLERGTPIYAVRITASHTDFLRTSPSNERTRSTRRVHRTDNRQRDGNPRRQVHQGHLPGHHRQPGDLPHPAGARLRHAGRGRRDAGQGRQQAPRRQARRRADLRHGAGGQGQDRRQRHLHLRAAALRRRRHPGGHRRRDAADRRASPRASRCSTW